MFVLIIVCFCCYCSKQIKETGFSSSGIQGVIESRCSMWSAFEAKFKVKSVVKHKTFRYTLHVWKKKDKLKLDVFSLWGQTLAEAIFNRNLKSVVWLVTNKEAYISNDVEQLVQFLTGITIQPFSLLNYVSGCFKEDLKQELASNSFNWCGNFLLCGIALSKPAKMELIYDPYFNLAELKELPSKITLITPDGVMNLSLLSASKNADIPDDIFNLNIPSDVLRHRL